MQITRLRKLTKTNSWNTSIENKLMHVFENLLQQWPETTSSQLYLRGFNRILNNLSAMYYSVRNVHW